MFQFLFNISPNTSLHTCRLSDRLSGRCSKMSRTNDPTSDTLLCPYIPGIVCRVVYLSKTHLLGPPIRQVTLIWCGPTLEVSVVVSKRLSSRWTWGTWPQTSDPTLDTHHRCPYNTVFFCWILNFDTFPTRQTTRPKIYAILSFLNSYFTKKKKKKDTVMGFIAVSLIL